MSKSLSVLGNALTASFLVELFNGYFVGPKDLTYTSETSVEEGFIRDVSEHKDKGRIYRPKTDKLHLLHS